MTQDRSPILLGLAAFGKLAPKEIDITSGYATTGHSNATERSGEHANLTLDTLCNRDKVYGYSHS